jgi:hypothetical protein
MYIYKFQTKFIKVLCSTLAHIAATPLSSSTMKYNDLMMIPCFEFIFI